MTHELKQIFEAYLVALQTRQKAVLATVVHVDGSSYRREGVRMLVLENDKTVGAVSGGCVEKEVIRQAQSVFKNGEPKIMTYDGRFRLGCEGTLYIMLEELTIDLPSLQLVFNEIEERKSFRLNTYYSLASKVSMGTKVVLSSGVSFSLKKNHMLHEGNSVEVFNETIQPAFQLVLFGSEHDSSKLCELATITGWLVTVVCAPNKNINRAEFPGVTEIIACSPENFDAGIIDAQTAVVLMSHNFAKDVLFLKALRHSVPCYIGLLGPTKRREQLLDAYIEYDPDVNEDFIEKIHGPAGLDIGAETPSEIAISIMSEILAVTRKKTVISLAEKKSAIHS